MWTLKTFSGQTFHLNDKEKDFYLKKVDEGAKMIVFPSFVLSANFEYLISDEHAKLEKLKANPILNDEDYAKYLQTKSPHLAGVLDRRYPVPKYQLQWDEANKNRNSLTGLSLTEPKSDTEVVEWSESDEIDY